MKRRRNSSIVIAILFLTVFVILTSNLLMSLSMQTPGAEGMALRAKFALDEPHPFGLLDTGETEKSNQDGDSDEGDDNIAFSEALVVVSNRTFSYRYPKSLSRIGKSSVGDGLVVGVLSSASNINRRNAVRRTWASGLDNVFFLVGGNWTAALADEFAAKSDLLWIGVPEAYRTISYKTNVFLHAVHAHVTSYEYAVKTDDDSYVNLTRVGHIIRRERGDSAESGGDKKLDYWGSCKVGTVPIRKHTDKWFLSREEYSPDTFPGYASGAGYAMSYEFLSCAVAHLADHRFVYQNEDVSTGLLAERCGVTCHHSDRIDRFGDWPDDKEMMKNNVIFHQVYDENAMQSLLWAQRQLPLQDDSIGVSCTGPLCSILAGA